jgi:hypothetical protein
MAVRRRLLHILLPKRKGKTRRGRNTPRNKNPLNLLGRSSILSVFHPGTGSTRRPRSEFAPSPKHFSRASAGPAIRTIQSPRVRAWDGDGDGGGDLRSLQIIRCRGSDFRSSVEL